MLRPLSVFLLVWLAPHAALGYYCDHNLCHATDEYCCGDNLCCDYENSSSYFWLSILIVLLFLAAGWALLSLFFLPVLAEKQDLVKTMCGSLLLNRARGPRKGPAWPKDPGSKSWIADAASVKHDKISVGSRKESLAHVYGEKECHEEKLLPSLQTA